MYGAALLPLLHWSVSDGNGAVDGGDVGIVGVLQLHGDGLGGALVDQLQRFGAAGHQLADRRSNGLVALGGGGLAHIELNAVGGVIGHVGKGGHAVDDVHRIAIGGGAVFIAELERAAVDGIAAAVLHVDGQAACGGNSQLNGGGALLHGEAFDGGALVAVDAAFGDGVSADGQRCVLCDAVDKRQGVECHTVIPPLMGMMPG